MRRKAKEKTVPKRRPRSAGEQAAAEPRGRRTERRHATTLSANTAPRHAGGISEYEAGATPEGATPTSVGAVSFAPELLASGRRASTTSANTAPRHAGGISECEAGATPEGAAPTSVGAVNFAPESLASGRRRKLPPTFFPAQEKRPRAGRPAKLASRSRSDWEAELALKFSWGTSDRAVRSDADLVELTGQSLALRQMLKNLKRRRTGSGVECAVFFSRADAAEGG